MERARRLHRDEAFEGNTRALMGKNKLLEHSEHFEAKPNQTRQALYQDSA
jgi:hypothetical protein